jgi:hypothetical protein
LRQAAIAKTLLALACFAIAGCSEPESSPEEELRNWVARGEAAAEDRDRGELLDMISSDYADGRGNDRDQIGNLLRVYFFRHQVIALMVTIDDIIVTGETAAMIKLTVAMAGTGSGALGIKADAYRFEFEVQKPADEWLLIGARWASVGRALH